MGPEGEEVLDLNPLFVEIIQLMTWQLWVWNKY
jgi:hypothetical protein